ncbi:MAG: NAD(P)H-binding protein [Rhodospirillaceae bacterium]
MLRSIAFILIFVFSLSRSLLAADLVLVAGGTGGTGWETVKAAKAAGYKVRATTTNLDRAKERFGEDEIEWVKMDARKLDDVRAATKDVDYVISTIGGSCYDPGGPSSAQHVDYQGVVNMAGVALTMGVKQFVLTSALGAGIPDQPLNQFCDNVQMWKWLGEDYIRDSELNYTIIRPGGLGDDEGGKVGIILAPAGTLKTSFIQRADVASVLVAALGQEDSYRKTIAIGQDKSVEKNNWRDDFSSIPLDPKQMPPISPR